MHTGCTRPAGSSRLASKKAASAGPCVHARGNRCDLIEINSPERDEWLPLAACSNAPDVSRKPTDPRARGRPWATGSTVESHVAPPMCSVHSRTGQRACPATRAASCSAADGRRAASARFGYVGSIMGAPSCAIDHHRNKPSPEAILHRATKRRCFCAMLAAATMDPRRAALVRVPCPRWPTRIRRLGVPCASEERAKR